MRNRFRSMPGKAYPLEFRLGVVKEFLSGVRRCDLAMKYNMPDASVISHWVRKFGPDIISSKRKVPMSRRKKKIETDAELSMQQELTLLRKKLLEKEKELASSELRAKAYEAMIQIAESRFDIEIRKKSGPKQS